MKHKMARQVRDPLTTQFLNAMLETPLPKIAEEIEDELCKLVSGYASDQELANGCIDRSDQDAAELLETAITDWTEILRQEPVWSSAKGLYVQRRLPIDLFGLLLLPGEANRAQRQSMNVGTERILVNSLGAGKLADDLIVDQAATFPVSSEDIAPLFKHVLRAQHLWLLQNTARIVGKGCGVSFDLGDLPKTSESDALRAAMDVYDARHQNGGPSDVGIAGTNVLVLAENQTPTTIAACHYLGEHDELRLVAPELAAEFMAVKDKIAPIQYQPMFQFDHFDLKPLSKLFVNVSHSGDWHDKNLPAILALLHALGRSKSLIYDYQIRRFGYIRVSRDELFRLLADFNDSLLVLLRHVLPGTSNVSLTPADLFRALLKVDGKIWPVTDGPVVRQSPDGALLVDIVTASRRMIWLLLVGVSGGGHLPNLRGAHFELAVQAEIDRKACSPGPGSDLVRLRGRQLKRDDKTLTDIDAIAELPDGTILLIQAKSYPYTPDYAAGRFRDVRNVTTKVSQEANDWKEKISDLSTHRRGANQNYELPLDSLIIPVFITPFPVYLPHPQCDEEALPGLRYIGSLEELSTYLGKLCA